MNRILNTKELSLIMGAIFISSFAIAQEQNAKIPVSNPMPVEVFFGNSRFVSQITINKKLTEKSGFGLLATSYTAADYANDKTKNESVNAAFITYNIVKGFGLVSGAVLNSSWGFRPYSGLRYFYADKQFLATVIPGFYLTESHNFETIGVAEYRPHIKKDWSVYSRIEGLYNADMDTKKHDRSFIYGRLGLNYKTFSFGFAVNCDWYGPFKANKNNTGVFFRTVFR